MSRDIITFYDLETTGVNDPEERIIEACFGLYDNQTEKRIGFKTWRVDPLVPIKPSATKVHGIRIDDVRGEPTFDLIAPEIVKIIKLSGMMVAHNGDEFDYPFLDRELQRVSHKVVWPKRFDTMKKARWATHNGKNPRLGELALCLDVAYDDTQAHAAEYDTDILAQCFFEGRRIGWF